jgi:hypothetical protein
MKATSVPAGVNNKATRKTIAHHKLFRWNYLFNGVSHIIQLSASGPGLRLGLSDMRLQFSTPLTTKKATVAKQ